MNDEPKMIQAVAGPYAGQRLTMPKVEAEAAIADKWAIDPFAPIAEAKDPKDAKDASAKDMSEDERAQIKAKAEQAARKLRGETDEPDKPAADESAKPADEPTKPADMAQARHETRDLSADESHKYPTRGTPRK